jgi:indolepyruvate ferredoxin oxidoreductase alpha subunit
MTGAQEPVVPSSRLEEIARASGVSPEHFHVVDAHPRRVGTNAWLLRREIAHRGLSVIIARRECKVAAKRHAHRDAGAAAAP